MFFDVCLIISRLGIEYGLDGLNLAHRVYILNLPQDDLLLSFFILKERAEKVGMPWPVEKYRSLVQLIAQHCNSLKQRLINIA